MVDASSSAQVKPESKKPRRPLWTRFIHYSIRQARKRKAEKKPEAPADKAARRTANATIAIAFFTLVLVIVSYFQWMEIHHSSGDTQQILEVQTRPWLGLNGDKATVVWNSFNGKSATIAFRINLSNYGHAPALDAFIWVEPDALGLEGPTAGMLGGSPAIQRRICDEATKGQIRSRTLGSTAFTVWQGSVPVEKVITSRFGDPYGGYVRGCISYMSPSGAQHSTFFIYLVTLSNPSDTTVTPFTVRETHLITIEALEEEKQS
mgnify:CR=1 FL=1